MSVAKLGDRRRLFELFTALRDKSQLATKTGVYTCVSLGCASTFSASPCLLRHRQVMKQALMAGGLWGEITSVMKVDESKDSAALVDEV